MRTISPDALPSSVLEISYLLGKLPEGAGNLAVGELAAKPPTIPIELDKLSRAILRRQQGRLRKAYLTASFSSGLPDSSHSLTQAG